MMQKILIYEENQDYMMLLKELLKNDNLFVEYINVMNFKEFKDNINNVKLVIIDERFLEKEEIKNLLYDSKKPFILLIDFNNNEIISKYGNEELIDYIIKTDLTNINYTKGIIEQYFKRENEKILLISKDEELIKKFTKFINRFNKSLIISNSFYEVPKILYRQRINIIFTEYFLETEKAIDSFDMINSLRTNYKKNTLSIIALTDYGRTKEGLSTKFLRTGGNDFLFKECNVIEFYSRLVANYEILDLFNKIEDRAIKDYLTNIYNRRYFFEYGSNKYMKSKRNNKDLYLIVMDIDKFKKINDEYGHDVGDLVIKEFVRGIRELIPTNNSLFARLGGEEFGLMIWDYKYEEIEKNLEEIMFYFRNKKIQIQEDKELQITVSIGVTNDYSEDLDKMMKISDELLYDVKNNGRNNYKIKLKD